MHLFKGIGVAITATAAAFALLPSTSAAAQPNTDAVTPAAVNCNWDPSRGTTGVSVVTTKSIRLRYGPASGCGFIGWTDMDVPTQLWAVCKYRNPDSGNTWYYVDPSDTSWRDGWIYAGNVRVGSGTIPSC